LRVVVVRKRGFGVPFPAIGLNRRSFGYIPRRIRLSFQSPENADGRFPNAPGDRYVQIAANIDRFEGTLVLLKHLGFEIRTKGSHHIFRKTGVAQGEPTDWAKELEKRGL
jgi:hypothetical protein